MKKLFYIAAVFFLFSCNNQNTTTDKTAEVKTADTSISLPFKMAYEGTPSIGKTENIATVMNFNGDFIAGKMDNIGSYLADSVHVVFADGTEENAVRDSIAVSYTHLTLPTKRIV